MSLPKRILVATDFSACAQAALDTALTLARAFQAELVLVHVVPDVSRYLVLPDPLQSAPEVWEVARRHADRELERLANGIEDVGVRTELRDGAIEESILAAARSCNAELLVLGTHGRTGLKHLLMGSVAEAIVRRAPVPVLTVRSPAAAAAGRRRAEVGAGVEGR